MSERKNNDYVPLVMNVHYEIKMGVKIKAARARKSVTEYVCDLLKKDLENE